MIGKLCKINSTNFSIYDTDNHSLHITNEDIFLIVDKGTSSYVKGMHTEEKWVTILFGTSLYEIAFAAIIEI